MTAPVVRRQMTQAEWEFLIGDGSIAGAIAGVAMRFVYDEECDGIPARRWREHYRLTGHEAWAFEVAPDYETDCIVFVEETPLASHVYAAAADD